MLFSSLVFIFGYLPVVLLGFALASRFGRTAAGTWLIVASLVFYGWWDPPTVLILLLSISLNYVAANGIIATERRPRLQAMVTAAAVSGNLAALFYYKYLAATLSFVAGFLPETPIVHNIVLPLGISFFTFTQIGYLVDCRAGITRDRNLLNYVLFVTFFPHLIAGPILHHRDIMTQFADSSTYRISARNMAVGIAIFAIGLVKKAVLADPLVDWVAEGYGQATGIGWTVAWNAALCYSLQLYFDFSGYSDMAIGLARMINVRFPRNFESPYKALGVIEYWQRWHMTLTHFLTSYLYTPIAMAIMRMRMHTRRGINRAAQQTLRGFAEMLALPLMVTMTLAGIWHGAGATFVVFGVLHGIYLCVNHAWRTWRPQPASRSALSRMACCLLTYLGVLAASVFFRAASCADAVQILAGMTGLHGVAVSMPSRADALHAMHLAVLYAIVWIAPCTQQIMYRFDPVLGEIDPPRIAWLVWDFRLPAAICTGIAAAAGILALGGTTEFLYFQF